MSFNLRKSLFSLSAATVLCAALQSGAVSGQILSSTGSDNNTRVLLRATDSSIALWLLNPVQDNVNPALNKYYGPYVGWEPLGITTAADNYSWILWKNTNGQIGVWLLDPALNLVNHKEFGPEQGWNVITLSAKPNGQLSVIWKNTTGELAVWLVDRNFNILQDKHFGPFPAFDPGK